VRHLLGVRRPGGALARCDLSQLSLGHGDLGLACYATSRRQAAAGQSGDKAPHSKEINLL
jgi:hypothetical protein